MSYDQIMDNSNQQVLSGQPAQTAEEQPLLVLKPKFIFSLFFLTLIPTEIFLAIWAPLFFGGFGLFGLVFLNSFFHLTLPLWLPAVSALVFVLFGLPILSYFLSAGNYKKTEYRFYKNRLEYMDGFINMQQRSIEYKNVTSVSIRKGFFQRMYNVGSLLLITPSMGFISTSGMGAGGLAGVIVLVNIEEPEKVYQYIQGILNQTKTA